MCEFVFAQTPHSLQVILLEVQCQDDHLKGLAVVLGGKKQPTPMLSSIQ